MIMAPVRSRGAWFEKTRKTLVAMVFAMTISVVSVSPVQAGTVIHPFVFWDQKEPAAIKERIEIANSSSMNG